MTPGFETAMAGFTQGAAPRPPSGLVKRLEGLHHTTFPEDLRALINLHDQFVVTGATPVQGLWELLPGDPAPGDLVAPLEGAGNLFEQVVCFDQEHFNGSFGIMQIAGRVLPLGAQVDCGDVFFASLLGSGQARVSLSDHETHFLTGFVANQVADLPQLQEPIQWLSGDTGHLDDFARNLPYAALLSNHPDIDPTDTFEELWEAWEETDDPQPMDPGRMTRDCAAAFHFLWHPFFRGHDEALDKAVSQCKGSQAPMIRDMAQLVEELHHGRKTLGTISDIHTVRRWVCEEAPQ